MVGTQLRESLPMNAQGLELLPDNALRHIPAQILHQKPHTAVLQERQGVETYTLPPIEEPQCTDSDSETVGGTTISFSAFSWAFRPPG